MKSLEQWFDEYAVSHQNPLNQLIHKVCVPTIMFSVLGLLWAANPMACYLFVAACFVFYALLSVKLLLGMIVMTLPMLYVLTVMSYHLEVSLGLFIVAWIFQFYGHKVEGKKPSFFKDVQFLLIGPIWVLAFAYRKLGLSY